MCSLNFGLIRDEPSRDLVDEYDTEFANIRRTYSLKLENSRNCKVLLLTSCKLSEASVKVYLDYDDKSLSDVGKILEKDFDIGTKELLRTKVVAQFVRISDDLVHCVVTEPIHMYWQNEFSKEIMNYCSELKCMILALTSDRKANYFFPSCDTEARDSPKPLTRILKTPNLNVPDDFPLKVLQRPNLIHGLSAAVLTAALFEKQDCLLICSFTDLECFDSFTLSGFGDAFKSLKSLGYITSDITNAVSKAKLKKMFSSFQDSALYV